MADKLTSDERDAIKQFMASKKITKFPDSRDVAKMARPDIPPRRLNQCFPKSRTIAKRKKRAQQDWLDKHGIEI